VAVDTVAEALQSLPEMEVTLVSFSEHDHQVLVTALESFD